jgi:hypothetical protein
MNFRSGWILLALLALLAACSQPKPECYVDSDCNKGQLCERRACVKQETPRPPWKPEPGQRTAGQTCDPRAYGWGWDRCASGFHCAMKGVLASTVVTDSSSSLDLNGA